MEEPIVIRSQHSKCRWTVPQCFTARPVSAEKCCARNAIAQAAQCKRETIRIGKDDLTHPSNPHKDGEPALAEATIDFTKREGIKAVIGSLCKNKCSSR